MRRVPKEIDMEKVRRATTLSVEEYATLVGCGLATAYRAVDEGEVPVIRHGRVRRIVAADVRKKLGIQ